MLPLKAGSFVIWLLAPMPGEGPPRTLRLPVTLQRLATSAGRRRKKKRRFVRQSPTVKPAWPSRFFATDQTCAVRQATAVARDEIWTHEVTLGEVPRPQLEPARDAAFSRLLRVVRLGPWQAHRASPRSPGLRPSNFSPSISESPAPTPRPGRRSHR